MTDLPYLKGLIEKLREREFSGQFAMGGGTISSDGTIKTWGGERIMRARNPDGPEAATAISDLIGEVERLRTALRAAETQFLEYERHHRAKAAAGPEGSSAFVDVADTLRKAERNRGMADMCRAALGESVA